MGDYSLALSIMRFVLLISIIALACGNPKEKEQPTYLLAPEEMSAVLTDVHLLKGKISVWRLREEVSQVQEDSLFQLLYAKHQVLAADFDSSLSYYSMNRPELIETIYIEVVESLQEKEADLEH